MAEFKNRINVTINDQNYTIIADDDPDHIRHVAGLVDESLRLLSRKRPGLDTTRKAVLTALNVMNDYVKLEEDYIALQQELEALQNRDA